MSSGNRILICPLDWGLGHATRCIPIIRDLIELNQEVIIGSSRAPSRLLSLEFPQLEAIDFPGYSVKYPANGNMTWSIGLQLPKIMNGIKREHELLQKIVAEHHIDAVISDNRYGLWHEAVPTAFITHQVFIKSPVAQRQVERINHDYISRFNHCWIPDYEGSNNLSGELSHDSVLPHNCSYIGPVSRFTLRPKGEILWDYLCIVSGPEPQRSIFEDSLLTLFEGTQNRVLLVLGKPVDNEDRFISDGVRIVSHMNAEELQNAISQSQVVVSRSGYSTVMDMAAMGQKAILVPTPGQTEQEYLSSNLNQSELFRCVPQPEINNLFEIDFNENTPAAHPQYQETDRGRVYKNLLELIDKQKVSV